MGVAFKNIEFVGGLSPGFTIQGAGWRRLVGGGRESLEKYYELYKPDSVKKQELYKERKKYIQLGFLISGIGVTYYLYTK